MSSSTTGDFSNKKLRNVDFTNARIVGASMVNASFDGHIYGLRSQHLVCDYTRLSV